MTPFTGTDAQEQADQGVLKVLHLIYSSQLRGAENFALQLSSRLASAGFSQSLCSIYGLADEQLAVDFPILSLQAERGGIRRLSRFDTGALSRLVRLAKDYRPHLILAHGADTLKYGVLTKLFLPSVRTVYRNIGTASYWAGSPVKVGLSKLLLRHVDAVVSVGENTALDFARTYGLPESRMATIPNAVDVQPFLEMDTSSARSQSRQDLGISKSATVMIFVGNLSEEKNPQELLRIFANLEARGIEGRLLIVGDGPLRAGLEKSSLELGIRDRVRFLGTRKEVHSLLAASDLLLLPSRTEGMPAVLIEAGLAGLASVAYGVGDVGEVIEPHVTGFLIRPGNSEDFENAVAAAINDPEMRSAMGAAARLRCLSRFAMETIAPEYEGVIRRLVDNRGELPVAAGNDRGDWRG